MGFWKGFGKVLLQVGKVAAVAVAETAASGKPITLGNIGRDAGKIVVDQVKDKPGSK